MDTTFSHIKAVFCDIDGTLLTSQHTVSPRTVAAIRALRERGVLFGLCTGRDAHATEAMYELWVSKAWWTCWWAAVAPRSSTARTTSTS